MIQRIQSVYLAGASLVLASAAFVLYGMPENVLVGPRMVFVATFAGMGLAGLISIFLYAKRERQRTVVRTVGLINLLVLLALVAVLYLNGELPHLYAGAPVPFFGLLVLLIFSLLLFYQAAKAIKRDIDLVRSMDRIR